MDFDALKTDLRRALSRLPPGLVDLPAVAERIKTYRKELEKVLPEIMEDLKPHVMTGMVEASMSILDQEGIEAAAVEVLGSMGVRLPDAAE